VNLIKNYNHRKLIKKKYTDDNANNRVKQNVKDQMPDGSQMQEKSVILVIMSVLVLLLDMNGLLTSSEVGDPLQVIVGIMLIVFGINVLVEFKKDPPYEARTLGTIRVWWRVGNKQSKTTNDKVVKAAAIFGTIVGVLCAVLGAQILLKSVVKKMPSFKIKRPSFKSLKRKKKKIN